MSSFRFRNENETSPQNFEYDFSKLQKHMASKKSVLYAKISTTLVAISMGD